MICGPLCPQSAVLPFIMKAERHTSVRLYTDVERMADVVMGARLVISAAGSTTWELLSLGIPVLSVPVSENQRLVAEAAGRRGAVVDAGYSASADAIVEGDDAGR